MLQDKLTQMEFFHLFGSRLDFETFSIDFGAINSEEEGFRVFKDGEMIAAFVEKKEVK